MKKEQKSAIAQARQALAVVMKVIDGMTPTRAREDQVSMMRKAHASLCAMFPDVKISDFYPDPFEGPPSYRDQITKLVLRWINQAKTPVEKATALRLYDVLFAERGEGSGVGRRQDRRTRRPREAMCYARRHGLRLRGGRSERRRDEDPGDRLMKVQAPADGGSEAAKGSLPWGGDGAEEIEDVFAKLNVADAGTTETT